MPNWRPEVSTDSSGKWYPNGLVFASEEEAYRWAKDLALRWTLVRDWRAAPTNDPVNRAIVGDDVVIITPEEVENAE